MPWYSPKTGEFGHYVAVLSVLGLVEGFAKIASDDKLGRKLRGINGTIRVLGW